MRENRLAKLAGLKKMAGVELSDRASTGAAFQENKGFYETSGGTILYCDENKKWFIAADSSGKIRGATVKSFTPVSESETYKVISANPTLEAQEKFRNFREKAQAESAAYYEAESDKSQAKKVKSPSGAPQGTRAPVRPFTITHAVGTKLKDISYEYEIMDQNGSFEWIDLNDSKKHGTFSLSQSGIPKWNKAVAALNALTPQTSPVAAAVAAAVPAVTPAAAPAEAATPATTVLDQNLIQKVAVVLNKALLFRLNLQSAQSEQDEIRSLKNKLGSTDRLAAIIVSRVGENLKTLSAATLAEINSGTRKDLAVNMKGKFAGDVGTILRQVSEITRMENISRGSIKRLAERLTETPASPTATAPTTAPVAEADDGQNKSASLNKKFIKAATLRRLKIRSQMEAAIDSSAQMGRARVS
jgi:hypothetical protein